MPIYDTVSKRVSGGGNGKPTKNEKKSRFMDFDKGTTVRINMQTFGAGKWPSGSVGYLVGEYDAFGAPGISPGKLRIRE